VGVHFVFPLGDMVDQRAQAAGRIYVFHYSPLWEEAL
jgi:hypothetical protein